MDGDDYALKYETLNATESFRGKAISAVFGVVTSAAGSIVDRVLAAISADGPVVVESGVAFRVDGLRECITASRGIDYGVVADDGWAVEEE